MYSGFDSVEDAVGDIFSLFDHYVAHDITRVVVYGSALNDIETADDIDLIVVGSVGKSMEAELAFHMVMDEVWPEGKFGPSDHLVITEGEYKQFRDADDSTAETTMDQHIIDAIQNGKTFHRDEFITPSRSRLDMVRSVLGLG